jgi:ATP-dependent protease Clp ATPase subunit
MKYGIRAELAGRFHSVIEFKPLSNEELLGVANGVLRNYKALLERNIEFENEEDLIEELKFDKIGCREIRHMFNSILEDAMFNIVESSENSTIKIKKKNGKFITEFLD